MLFLSIVSLYFSPSLLRWLPPFSFPYSETMVKDNIYRKPPIYRQHGTVFLTLPTLVWSLHDVLHVICQSSVSTTSPPNSFFVSFFIWILQINMHRAGVPHFNLAKHWNCRNVFWLCPEFCCLKINE